jgi:hypothetical protein
MHKDANTIRGVDYFRGCHGDCDYSPVLSNMLF